MNLKYIKIIGLSLALQALFFPGTSKTEGNLDFALRRASYLLTGSFPDPSLIRQQSADLSAYKNSLRSFLDSNGFYDAMLRYHEKLLGVGLPETYLEELQREEFDDKKLKIARLHCSRQSGKFNCVWQPGERKSLPQNGQCPSTWMEPVVPFWKTDLRLWVCPSITQSCGADLSRCFITFADPDEARNSELGTSEAFDTRLTVTKSLSKQAAGLAAAVVTQNYPYTTILKSGVHAVDSAIVHLLNQEHHFDLSKMHVSKELLSAVKGAQFKDTRFHLLYTGESSSHAGVLSTFGYLRRYEKNRTRANQMYERLMCRKFTSEPPKVFPQDPGNLRTAPGCSGCHATLDPLADFFSVWGEGGELYNNANGVPGTFIGKTGTGLKDLSEIVVADNAFATCAVQNVWKWLVGRDFYKSEENIRNALTNYFGQTQFSFKELVYAVASHPTFIDPRRADATVTDPLEQPAIGKVPEQDNKQECKPDINFQSEIAPKISQCTTCHNSSNSGRQSLETEADWKRLGSTSVGLISSGNMPPGQTGSPSSGPLWEFKESLRCWLEQNP